MVFPLSDTMIAGLMALISIVAFIPYLALPLGMALLTWRFLQLAWQIIRGNLDKIIASHEVEDELEELADTSDKKGDA